MRKALLAASALLTLSMLAACGQGGSSSQGSSAASAPVPAQPQTPQPEPKPATESAAVSGGAYGMPRSPVPYDQLTAYEAQQGHMSGQAPPLLDQPAPNKNRRESDSVFY